MYSAPCLTGVFSICFFLFVTIWVTSLGSILRSCELRRNFSFTPCFRGPQMVRYASAFRLLPAQVHSSGPTAVCPDLFSQGLPLASLPNDGVAVLLPNSLGLT